MKIEQLRCPRCGQISSAVELMEMFHGMCPRCLAGIATEPVARAEGEASGPTRAVPEPLPLEPGSVFHHLEVLEVLGRGGMGVVYKARQRELDRFVALKILPAKLAADPEFVSRFRREAKALAALSHPNIVAIHDFGTDEAFCFLVMEYVDGTNLRRLLTKKRRAPDEALRIVPQICDALDYAHRAGVVHRDIKPENILIARDGRVKIADFGLARVLTPGSEPQTLTRTDLLMGTPQYMAPEQHQGLHAADRRADIYSLGVILYEMLTGEIPRGKFPPPSASAPVDARLDRIVMKALDRDPGLRYQTASEMKTDVTTALAPSRSAPAGARWAVVLVFAAVLGLAAIPIVRVLRKDAPPVPSTATKPSDPPPKKDEGTDLMKEMSRWRWERRNAESGSVKDELLFAAIDGRNPMEASPEGVTLGRAFSLRFRLRYEIEPAQEPWIIVKFEGDHALIFFPQGDHTLAFAKLHPGQGWELREKQPLPKGIPAPGSWHEVEIRWHGASRRLWLTVDGAGAFDHALDAEISLAGPFAFSVGGAAKEVRLREVGLKQLDSP